MSSSGTYNLLSKGSGARVSLWEGVCVVCERVCVRVARVLSSTKQCVYYGPWRHKATSLDPFILNIRLKCYMLRAELSIPFPI